MQVTFDREMLLKAFNLAALAVPTRTPKPVLESVLLRVDECGRATLTATDLEVSVRCDVLGVSTSDGAPMRVLLPHAKARQILVSAPDPEMSVSGDGDKLTITSGRSRWTLPQEDPDDYPGLSLGEGGHSRQVDAQALSLAMKRTWFATDPDSTRYALGGVLFEFGAGLLTLVGTDGRRLALHEVRGDGEEGPSPVLPVKALKLVDRAISPSDAEVKVSTDGNSFALFDTGKVEVYTRLVEGRYPNYRQILPSEAPRRATFDDAADLAAAFERAAVATSKESRGVDCTFREGDLVGGTLTLEAEAPDVGSSSVELPVSGFEGEEFRTCLDGTYVAEALRAVGKGVPVAVELRHAESPAVLRAGDDYTYVVMPLRKDR